MVERTIPWWRKALHYALDGIRSGFGLFSRSTTSETAPELKPQANLEEALEEETVLTDQIPNSDSNSRPKTESDPKSILVDAANVAETVSAPKAAPVVEQPDEASRGVNVHPAAKPEAKVEVAAEPIVEETAAPQTELAAESIAEVKVEVSPTTESAHEAKPNPEATASPEMDLIEEARADESRVAESVALLTEDAAPKELLVAEPIAPPEAVTEPVVEETAEADTEIAPIIEAAAEEALGGDAETELSAASDKLSAPESEPAPPDVSAVAAAEPAATGETAPTLPFAAQSKAERTTADKVAAALKARGQDDEQSPFSVIVGQVYDGPLDLLLDLIRKQDIDIYDIPIARITSQFLAYVNQLRASDMDVAGEFIYTASLLIHIKSKMLLPRAPAGPEDAAEDPRRELVERLLEHERFKNAAQMLQQKQMVEAATWTNPGVREFQGDADAEPEIAADTVDLVRIFRDILERARNRPVINVEEDAVTVGQMIQFLARRLSMEDHPVALRRLLSHTRSERALIAMFLALLELVRLQAILLRQDRHFSEIFIKKHSGFDAAMNQGLANARDDWR